ncbi:MAG: hypothetical protein WBO16_20110 [Gammaproteobacteria bacterium]|jgi:hypothetical protein
MRKASPKKNEINKQKSNRDQKKLRAAEARYRYEIMQEERLLQDNLADFWDTRFEKRGQLAAPRFAQVTTRSLHSAHEAVWSSNAVNGGQADSR